MVSPPPALTPTSAATNSAADETTGFVVTAVTRELAAQLEMSAFDRLPAFWRSWLRDHATECSAIQLTQKLKQRGILP